MDDPRVAVEPVVVRSQSTGDDVVMDDLLVVTCSEHGQLSEWHDLQDRYMLQLQAKRHAADEHDDLVDAVGWAR